MLHLTLDILSPLHAKSANSHQYSYNIIQHCSWSVHAWLFVCIYVCTYVCLSTVTTDESNKTLSLQGNSAIARRIRFFQQLCTHTFTSGTPLTFSNPHLTPLIHTRPHARNHTNSKLRIWQLKLAIDGQHHCPWRCSVNRIQQTISKFRRLAPINSRYPQPSPAYPFTKRHESALLMIVRMPVIYQMSFH